LFDYPQAFNLYVRVNFVSGGAESEGFTFTGSEGTMQIGAGGSALLSDTSWGEVSISRLPRETEPGTNIDSWANATQARFMEEYRKKYPLTHPAGPPPARAEVYAAPAGYNDSYDHLKNFFEAVRTRAALVEDPVFGYRAAAAALLSNLSYERNEIVRWDPEEMKLL
jgi:hypothetical protein